LTNTALLLEYQRLAQSVMHPSATVCCGWRRRPGPAADTGLQDAPASGGELLARMEEHSLKELRRKRPELARMVFEVYIQQKDYPRARTLAAQLDPSGRDGLLNSLAHAAVSDGSFAIGLELLDELASRRETPGMDAAERLDRARALEGLGHHEPRPGGVRHPGP
jgi:hypothetical protein